MQFNFIKPRQPAPAPWYRFADFNRAELFLMRALTHEEIARLDDCLNKAVCETLKKEIAENGQTVARLYDEISAALLQLSSDERRQGGWWK